MTYQHNIYLQQVGLKKLGFDPGPLDGIYGRKTKAAFRASENERFASSKLSLPQGYPPRPEPTYHSKVAVFGKPGKKDGASPSMSSFTPPYPMYYFGTRIPKIWCHKLVAAPMYNALKELLDTYGLPWIQRHGLDQFAGCYNPRKSRAGRFLSDHAWAIAFDLASKRKGNGLRDAWRAAVEGVRGVAMPRAAMKIFRKHGFQVGFKRSNGTRRDMMHVAYVARP